MIRSLTLFCVLGSFTAISFWIFNEVYATSRLIIDEEFHIRQGLHFCNGRFHIWDRKITTFPGLYFLSTLVLAPLDLCSDYYLRLTSFICQSINFVILFEFRRSFINSWKVSLLEALTISLLPPLYFFGHLYYTDVPALTMVLLLLLAARKGNHLFGAIFGIFSVAMRQTNVVWVALVFGVNALTYVISRAHPFVPNRKAVAKYTMKDLITVANVYIHRPDLIIGHACDLVLNFYGYLSILCGFLIFVWYNGSIVIGDKCAHEAALHVPQIFYFSLFLTFFAPSLIVSKIIQTVKGLRTSWFLHLLAIAVGVGVVHFNTIVHPYLLADNRHYIFYVWNRFFGPFEWFRYALVPVYVVSLSATYLHLKEQQSVGFIICYVICTFASIGLQKLFELRYFLLPYIVLRLHLKDIKPIWIIMELILYVAINAVTFYLFFTKEIQWGNYTEPQRLIW